MVGTYFLILIDIICSAILILLNLLTPSAAKASSAVKHCSALCFNKVCGSVKDALISL
jgi:hypothetical protein